MYVNVEVVFGGVILLMLGIAILVGLVSAYFRPPIEWKEAMGVIEESNVQPSDDSPTASAVFRFKFLVEDQPYWGNDRVWRDSVVAAQELADQLPVGAGVTIYFDASNPEIESTLVKPRDDGTASFHQIVLGVIVLALLTAIPLVVGGLLISWGLDVEPELNPNAVKF